MLSNLKNGDNACEAPNYPISSYIMKITYNSDYHYPQEISKVVTYSEKVDGSKGYTMKISNFEILEK